MHDKLALFGGDPVRKEPLTYARHEITNEDIEAVVASLRSGWLTTGPSVQAFEEACKKTTSATFAVAVNSGTAALHAAVHNLNLQEGDEVIVPPMSFMATANVILFEGGTPVFVDVDPNTLLLSLEDLKKKISSKTKAVIAVDYAGQACSYDEIRDIIGNDVVLIADACHSLGGSYKGRAIGSVADMTCFSFHAAKVVTSAEGGALTTNNESFAQRARRFRHHGMSVDHIAREEKKSWQYDMMDLGYNYRMSDMQAALGKSQLSRLDVGTKKRKSIAEAYNKVFSNFESLAHPLRFLPHREHAYFLYTVLVSEKLSRNEIFDAFVAEGISPIVAYTPIYMMSYYQEHFPHHKCSCPHAERLTSQVLCLPIYSSMTEKDTQDVQSAIEKVFTFYKDSIDA